MKQESYVKRVQVYLLYSLFLKRLFFSCRPKRVYPLIILCSLIILVSVMKIIGLYINITPSLPRGLYRAASGGIHRGDIIAFCLPPDLTLIGLEEHFILPGRTCPKSNALIKQVIAVPGDSITLTWQTIQVNSTIYPYPTQVSTSNHHPLETIPRGVYRATGYWVIGTHATNSWDSRYWGEVKPENILSKLKPILTETK